MRYDNHDLPLGTNFEEWLSNVEDRLFQKKDPALGAESRHQVLGSLKNEVPSQVRETNKIV